MCARQIGDRLRFAYRSDDSVTSVEELFGKVAAEAAADYR